MFEINFEHLSLGTFIAIYISGFITSLTPCVYPIIPIVVGYLGSRSGNTLARIRGAALYALGLSIVYTFLGMIAALTGQIFGSLTSNPYVYLFFGLLILTLGGNMMDWYYIPIPGLNAGKTSSNQSSLFGPFFLGLSSGLVASPCTVPVFGSLLLFIASKKAVITGGLLMFTFSLGMSTLLLALGFSAGFLNYLPKSGYWMVTVKKILALLLIGAGIYFIFMAGRLL